MVLVRSMRAVRRTHKRQRLNGKMHYLWRAVDHEGEIIERFVTKTRDKSAALRFLKKALKRHGPPRSSRPTGCGPIRPRCANWAISIAARWADTSTVPLWVVSCRPPIEQAARQPPTLLTLGLPVSNPETSCSFRLGLGRRFLVTTPGRGSLEQRRHCEKTVVQMTLQCRVVCIVACL